MGNFFGVERPEPDVYEFLECLRDPSVVKDDVFSLPAGVFLGGRPDLGFLGGTMLIRKCYEGLRDVMFDMVEKNKTEVAQNYCFIIMGNPGIGKSLFSYYMIYILMQLKQTIVWQPCGYKGSICITQSSIRRSIDGFPHQLAESSTWYIVDAEVPYHVEANTLLLCSPKTTIFKKFMNAGAHVLFMPVWSWTEIEKAQQLGLGRSRVDGKNGELGDVKESFGKWGGIPRYVFEFARERSIDGMLESALRDVDLVKIMSVMTYSDDSDSMLSLMHVTVVSDRGPNAYRLMEYVFASTDVERRVSSKFLLQCRGELIKFLWRCAAVESVARIYQSLFEAFAHEILLGGGTFQVRKLQKNQSPTDVFEIQLDGDFTRKVFTTLDDVTGQPKVYWSSEQKALVAIDSLLYPDMLFHMTVSMDHPVQLRGIQAAADRLLTLQDENKKQSPKRMRLDGDSPRVIRLYFVVPEKIFGLYKEQNDSDLIEDGTARKRAVDGTSWKSGVPSVALRVEQYALKVCITPE